MKQFTLFKKRPLQLFLLLGMASSSLLMSSCGTIAGAITGGKRPSFLINAPQDVTVKLNGEALAINSELFASNNVGKVSRDYYTAAVKMPYKNPVSIVISSTSTGKTATLDLKPKNSSAIFWGNIFIAPIVGHIIDGVTRNNKMLQPKYIDVESALNNVPLKDWPSQGKLKRIAKSGAKKNVIYN